MVSILDGNGEIDAHMWCLIGNLICSRHLLRPTANLNFNRPDFRFARVQVVLSYQLIYWVTQKLPQICTVILLICIGKGARFAVYICGNFWVTQ